MKPVRRTALQGEAIGDGEAIQGLGKGLDRLQSLQPERTSRAGGERVQTGAVACGTCSSMLGSTFWLLAIFSGWVGISRVALRVGVSQP